MLRIIRSLDVDRSVGSVVAFVFAADFALVEIGFAFLVVSESVIVSAGLEFVLPEFVFEFPEFGSLGFEFVTVLV